MATEQGLLINLPPEIYSIIATHLPLHATPSALLSLGLTNHHISEIALPLLYSRLILKNEEDALLVLQKLATDPSFGPVVRELHVLSNLSRETRIHDPPLDVITRVSEVILKGSLPLIHTLGLHLGDGWYRDDQFNPVEGFARPGKELWSQIKEMCPRLKALILFGFKDDSNNPWIEDSGLLHVPGITSFSICLHECTLRPSATQKLLQHISSLAPSLHTLNLQSSCPEFKSISSILELDFPCLRSLSLATFFTEVNRSQAMAFWERHPSIEYLDVASNLLEGDEHWFASVLPDKFLPKLRYLRVPWDDALLLAPILGQLLSLSINGSINAQIPYLLRSVCPHGLPKLKSLSISQTAHSSVMNKDVEGSLWYESPDGFFQCGTDKSSRTVFDGFMHSIVRGAPNLEEIGFHDGYYPLADFMSIASDLNGFTHLKHLYFDSHDMRDIFASQTKNLAEAIPGLVTITKFSLNQPYTVARITRRGNKQVASVEVGNGSGMKIGYEDLAFPWTPPAA